MFIEDLIADGFIKEAQKTCKSGETITISNGEAVAESKAVSIYYD